MKNVKKIISVMCILTILTSIVCIPTVTKAVSGSNSKVKWSINNNGVLTVSRKTKSGKTTILDYNSSSNKAPWNKYSSSIKSVVVNSNITRIGSYAFWGLTKATKITIGKHVEELGTAPFGHCDKLSSFKVASGSSSYKTSGGVLYNYSKSNLVAYPANKSGKTFTCPSSVKNIKGFAFSYNQNLTKFTQDSPGTIEVVNGSAFNHAKKLETITLKNNVLEVGNNAFDNITTLKSVTIPPSVTSVGSGLFLSPKKVKNLRIYCSKESKAYDKLSGKGYTISPQEWSFTWTLNANGGTCKTKKLTVIFGKSYTLPACAKTGYTYVGWYGSNPSKYAKSFKCTVAKSQTLYAKYSPNVYSIKLDANGGICNTSMIKVTYGKEIGELPTPEPPTGYKFIGWFAKISKNNDSSSEDEEDYWDYEDWEDEEDEEELIEINDEYEEIEIKTNTIYTNLDITTIYAKYQKPFDSIKNIKISYNTKNSVKLSWSALKDVTGYEIAVKINNGTYYSLINVPTNSTVVVTSNAKNKYTFKVRPYIKTVDNAYVYGDYSKEVVRNKTYVEAPQCSTKYKKSSGLLTVKWKKISNAQKYQVYQYKNKKWKKVKTTTSTAISLYTTSSKTYKFKVRAYTTVLGHKYYSKYNKVTFNSKTILKKPKVIGKFSKNKKYLLLNWKKVKGAKGYQIFRYINNKWKKVKTTAKRHYKIKVKQYNKWYRVTVRAYTKRNGNTYYSNFNGVKGRIRKT